MKNKMNTLEIIKIINEMIDNTKYIKRKTDIITKTTRVDN